MVQSNYKKVIFILIAALVIVGLIIFWSLFRKPTSNEEANNKGDNVPTYGLPGDARAMTEEEKIDRQIDPSVDAEVINDQGGMFIYKLKN